MHVRTTLERLLMIDLQLTGSANRINQRPHWSRFFGLVSRLGDGVFWYALMGLLLLLHGRAAVVPVAHMAGAGLSGTLVYKAIKHWSGRPRPYVRAPSLCLSTAPLDQFSFPSGHTLHAVVFSATAIYWFPALFWPLTLFTLMVAMSRLVLGLHYVTDVLAGALLGGGLAWLAIRLTT